MLRAEEEYEHACIYWHCVSKSGFLEGIPALENLRETAGQLGKERGDFTPRLSPIELLEQYGEWCAAGAGGNKC